LKGGREAGKRQEGSVWRGEVGEVREADKGIDDECGGRSG
jgi:hypothetical protein